jgi:hypothetical protein
MLLFKNHKAMTLIYHRNQGDNFWVFFSPLIKSEQNAQVTLSKIIFLLYTALKRFRTN